MSAEGQKLTKETYLDPEVVAGYIEANAKNPKLSEAVESFCKSVPGKRVIDIGCGPGHDSYSFAELGFEVTAIDYSPEMIRNALGLRHVENTPRFIVADMRDVGDMFSDDSFDGAWISASLLHIPEEDAPKVLEAIRRIVVNGGKVYVGIKEGEQGAHIVAEDKYKKPMQREFIFWQEDNFRQLVTSLGYKMDSLVKIQRGTTGGKPTTWLDFYLEVQK